MPPQSRIAMVLTEVIDEQKNAVDEQQKETRGALTQSRRLRTELCYRPSASTHALKLLPRIRNK
jgi:hypothetical protein